MNVGAWISLVAGIVAVGMACSILAKDPGQRASRLVALVLACSAHWSLCELLWNLSDDPNVVLWLVRLSGFGWLWLAPLCLEIYVEVAGETRFRVRRLIPIAYAMAGLSLLLYATPWGLERAFRTPWGWGYTFGPLFPVIYLPTMFFISLVLVMWPGTVPHSSYPAERWQSRLMFVGIGTPMIVASVTDVVMPYFGMFPPRMGSASIVILGGLVAWSIRRYGYFVLAPGAFAREVLETLRDGVALVAPDGRIRAVNEGLVRLAEMPRERLQGSSMFDLIPDLDSAVAQAGHDAEVELVSDRGKSVPISVSAASLFDEKNEVAGCVLVVRDLREVSNLRSRLVTSGRLAAVGELAAGIAHEINNPITYVRSNLVHLDRLWATLAEEAEKSDRAEVLAPVFRETSELFEESVEGIDRIAVVVRDVGEISHAGLDESEQVNVNELLESAINVAALSYSVVVERCYAELPLVRCNPQQLKQVLLNLLLNALQAVGDYGQIRLATQRTDDGIEISVTDDGSGIAPDLLDRIFDPFFTTRSAGEGTGLGLALSYQIVNNHGGEIRVDSEPGLGSCFRVLLPRG